MRGEGETEGRERGGEGRENQSASCGMDIGRAWTVCKFLICHGHREREKGRTRTRNFSLQGL